MSQAYFSRLRKTSPPTIADCEIVWWGDWNGRWVINEEFRFNFPATECILVVSRLSLKKVVEE